MDPIQFVRRRSAPTLRLHSTRAAVAASCLFFLAPVLAQDNVEDEPIPDEVPAAEPAPELPAAPASSVAPQTPAAPESPAAPTNPTVEPPAASTVAGAGGETVTVPRAVWEQLLRDVEDLKRARTAAPGTSTPAPSTPSTLDLPPVDVGAEEPTAPATPAGGGTEPVSTEGGRNYLLLPDISFVGNINGALSSDRRQEGRSALRFTEGEIGIQGTVYPNVTATAYLVGAPAEDEALGIEEGYLSFLGLGKNLNVTLGRKFVPFGRTGEQHPHSWLYARQLLPRRNLLSEESITGDGALFRYLLPTGKIYTNLDVGIFNGGGPGEISSAPFGDDSPLGPGASFTDRFYSARLSSGIPLGSQQELELGLSYAKGRAQVDDDTGTTLSTGRNTLNGVDISFRRFGAGAKRLLLRGEYFRSTPTGGLDAAFKRASGYYGLANLRFNRYNDVGLLYENTGFPQIAAGGAREKALSLIYTRQFTERFYTRLHLTRGNSPGAGGYNAAFLQFVFGLGPHSHNLE